MTEVYVASAFTKNGKGGNRAGVVLNRPDLTAAQKKQIAKTLGFSETAFVMFSDTADYRLEYFTPAEEVPLCGHATVAAFAVLHRLDLLRKQECTIETKAGKLRIKVSAEGEIFMEQNCPVYGERLSPEAVAAAMGSTAFDRNLPICVVSTGLRDVLLPMASSAALASLQPDFAQLTEFNRGTKTVGIHAFALAENVDAVCRDFAPLYGIPEESATGTASCALACYLFRYGKRKPRYVFEQGYELGEPSCITVELQYEQDRITGVYVGGHGCLLEKRSLPEAPEDLLERVAVMEQRFDRLLAAAEKPDMLRKDEDLKQTLRELTAYYEGGMWLEDYERDERGELPWDLKRGVLSEDGVYHLLLRLQPYMDEER